MIQYRLSQNFPHDSFLQVEIRLNPSKEDFELKLPDWRPGRYQLGNFSKYLRNFKAYDRNGASIDFQKSNRNTWAISNTDEHCVIRYEIYTSIIDGGSTYVDEEHWYLNFINCLMYEEGNMNQEHKVELDIPDNWTIACGLTKEGKTLVASSFYELVDSPAIIGGNLQKLHYKVGEADFYLWFRGDVDLKNKNQIIDDFKKFTTYQIETMGEFESKDYHFLYQIPKEKAYHGVEHLNSTCIVLGPDTEFNTDKFYDNFLGISSHELFHYWNIIRIRPKEMFPYKFDRENHFTTGYVAEGVTTYYGDLFLLKSGVKDLKWYQDELNVLFKRHFENYGRFNTSVAESSWDLWLDGYEAGIPDRKVSIYVKGALIALMLDLKIILKTEGDKNLDDVMRKLWNDFYKNGQGYSSENYLKSAEEVIGTDLTKYSNLYIKGCEPIENELQKLLPEFGFDLIPKNSDSPLMGYLGIKVSEDVVIGLAPKSPGENGLRIGDKIVSIDQHKFESLDDTYISKERKNYVFQIFRNKKLKETQLSISKETFYKSYVIEEKSEISSTDKLLRKKWLNK